MATEVVRIPGLTFGGALQVSNTTVITAALAGVALSLVAMHCMDYNKKGKHWRKEWKRHSPRAIENKVLNDVVSFAANVHDVANNLPAVRNVIHTMRPRINATIDAYNRGELTAEQFDSTIRNLYPMVTEELGIPVDSLPAGINRKFDNQIERIADSIVAGEIPAKIKFRMYKNHPGLARLHDMGRRRAAELVDGPVQAMHTSAGVYVKGWEREGFKGRGKAWGHDRDSPLFPGNR